jgi:GNAT superfamily N-acetyltransferase
MSPLVIDEVVIPATIDSPDAADFIRGIELGNEVEAISFGTPDLAFEPSEELPYFQDEHLPSHMLVARLDGEIVGRGTYETQAAEAADAAWLGAHVLPAHRGRGVGRALADELEAMALRDGKSKALVYAAVPDGPGARLESPTGFGSISVNRDVRFLQARGYRLEQIERMSRLPLPIDGLDDLVTAAQARTGPGYRVHTWIGSTPDAWVEDLAVLATRMSTDAPSAGLEEPADLWTADRIRERDEAMKASPRDRFTAVAEHVGSGRLAGFTVLSVPPQRHRAPAQFATLVLKEHRGHGLGMLLKVANLQFLERERPGHPSITTFNAEENRYMLDVNEAVGFVASANESAWRKDL